MDFRLFPLTHVFGGGLAYDFADAVALGRFYRDVMADAPEELQAYLTYSTGDGEKTASVVLCHCGPREAGEAVLERFRRFRRPVAERVGRITYLQMQQHWDDAFPSGKLHFWKSSFLATISDDAIRIGHEAIARQPLPGCEIDLEPMGGAVARVAPDATAFADRDAASTLIIATGWTDPARDRGPHRVGARDLDRVPALRQGLGLRQLPGPGRRSPHGSRLRRQLPRGWSRSSAATTPTTSFATTPTSVPDELAPLSAGAGGRLAFDKVETSVSIAASPAARAASLCASVSPRCAPWRGLSNTERIETRRTPKYAATANVLAVSMSAAM